MVGVVHGLAGSAAVALLVLASIPVASWALLYLVLFAVGTVGGMVLVTAALAIPFLLTTTAARVRERLVWATGVASILVGCGVAYQVVVAGGWLSRSLD